MKCPICNHELLQNESFCPQCGFEIHILPEGVSEAVKAYENARIEKYKNRGESAKGYLILRLADDKDRILDVLPVLQGINIYGRSPQKNSDTHSHRILTSSTSLEKEHFTINYIDDIFEIKLISGDLQLRNQFNQINTNGEILNDRDDIFIGNLVMTFIIELH